MKKFTLMLGLIAATATYGQNTNWPLQNTYKINTADTQQTILEKAVHVVPNRKQAAAMENEFIAFIHIGPNTFTRLEWGDGKEDPKVFDLKELDTDQWVKALQAAGMKMVVLTAKHHDGFVLWQSRYTKHGVMSTDFQNGKGDILKDLSQSCQKYGMKLGVYLSPADLYQIENEEGLYGNLSKKTLKTIPREIPGRPFDNKKTFEFEVDDYNEYYLNQLFECLTEYGPVHEIWLDGAHPKTKGGQTYDYAAWKTLIHELAPDAYVFGREDARWCGNESGGTRNTEWNVIAYQDDPQTMNSFPDMTDYDLGSREVLYKAPYIHYQPAETNTSIREGWFYRDDSLQQVRSADDVFDIYERAVGGNSIFMLNIPPNREGKLPAKDVAVLREVGKRINETYSNNLLQGANGPAQVLDGQTDTYLLMSNGQREIEITSPQPITFNRLALQESVKTHSERIEKFAVDAYINGQWKEIAQSTNIGYKRILRFPDVTTNKIRVRVLESRFDPTLATVAAYHYQARPPRLQATKDVNGLVSITPFQQNFGWKAHGEDTAGNLNQGFKIYYTTDGSEPTINSTLYTQPFTMENGELKAISELNGETGALLTQRMGWNKNNWKLLAASSEDEKHPATLAMDENSKSYWKSKDDKFPLSIAFDLGKNREISGFAYTPQTRNSSGMMSNGTLQISKDGKKWKDVEEFYFGNLVNDPSKRYFYLKNKINARYVRFLVTNTTDHKPVVAVAEIDVF